MKLLILGRTQFVGRHLVDAACGAGHYVTIVHRGKHRSHHSDVDTVTADRDADLAPLRGRVWDVAIDVAAYLPRTVEASIRALRQSVDRYVFISTLNVYADLQKGVSQASAIVGVDDDTVARLDAMSTEDARATPGFDEAYGGLKAR